MRRLLKYCSNNILSAACSNLRSYQTFSMFTGNRQKGIAPQKKGKTMNNEKTKKNNYTKFIIEGNLTGETIINKNKTIARGQIGWNSEETSCFASYEIRGAELLGKIKGKLTKGAWVRLEGSIRQDRWEYEGENYNKIVFVAFKVEFLAERNS